MSTENQKLPLKEIYEHFREIYGLLLKITQLNLKIEAENKRLLSINKMISQRSMDKHDYLEQLSKLCTKQILAEISALEKNIQQLKQNEMNLKTEKEIEAYHQSLNQNKNRLSELEALYFDREQETESLQLKIKETEQFLSGIEETKNEIMQEIKINIHPMHNESEGYKLRMQAIIETLPASRKNLFLERYHYFKKSNPFCLITTHKCESSQLHIDQHSYRQVSLLLAIELCPHCEKILLPVFL